MSTTLVARLDSVGDVLLTGPAVRAIAEDADRLVYLCSSIGLQAAPLLPRVDDILTFDAPWILAEPPVVDDWACRRLIDEVRAAHIERAVILTSFHQSPLPLALLFRLAGVEQLAGFSDDFPGSLLDVRLTDPGDIHEVERNLLLAHAAGHDLPIGDDRKLRVRLDGVPPADLPAGAVVVHPGASSPARRWSADRYTDTVRLLVEAGRPVIVTGSSAERGLADRVSGGFPLVRNVAGRLSLAGLARLYEGASAVITGNTGPAHLAAAVGTPVVSLFAPVVPAARWRPWGVPHVLLGAQDISCRGCRARRCPREGHPCLADVSADDVVRALQRVERSRPLRATSPLCGTAP